MADEQTNWEYEPDADSADEQSQESMPESMSWQANEFIDHDRSTGWYILLIFGTVGLAAVMYLLVKDYFATGAILIVGVVTVIYTSHKPKHQEYELSSVGIKIGEKSYDFSMFRSFSIVYEGEHTSIHLEPIKRYMPPMTVYFPPEKEQQITETIGNFLPFQNRQAGMTERLSHRFKL
jgi:hypothetical protein